MPFTKRGLAKSGEPEGHPFRGNQWTTGEKEAQTAAFNKKSGESRAVASKHLAENEPERHSYHDGVSAGRALVARTIAGTPDKATAISHLQLREKQFEPLTHASTGTHLSQLRSQGLMDAVDEGLRALGARK